MVFSFLTTGFHRLKTANRRRRHRKLQQQLGQLQLQLSANVDQQYALELAMLDVENDAEPGNHDQLHDGYKAKLDQIQLKYDEMKAAAMAGAKEDAARKNKAAEEEAAKKNKAAEEEAVKKIKVAEDKKAAAEAKKAAEDAQAQLVLANQLLFFQQQLAAIQAALAEIMPIPAVAAAAG